MKYWVFIFSFLFTSFLIAQNVNTGGKENLVIKGYISTSLFAQNQSFEFGNGQNAEWASSNYSKNQWFYGGDMRNTRLTLVFNGPKLNEDWKFGGVLELDAFGGFNGSGAFSQEQPYPRIRLAYADMIDNNLTIRIGQAWAPLFGNVPVSLSHIAFPLGWGTAGSIGWRFPGIFLYYKFDPNGSPTQFGLDAAIMEGSWSGPGSPVSFMDGGNLGTPQFELRFNLESKLSESSKISAYLVGHFDQVNLTPVDNSPTVNLTGTAVELGASFKAGEFLLQGNLYSGQNIGHQMGNMEQFSLKDTNLTSVGFWIQAGYNFTQEWSFYGFYGNDNVNKDNAKSLFGNAARLSNNLFDFMLKYQIGPLGLGVEYMQSKLTYGLRENTQTGTQIALSSLYNF